MSVSILQAAQLAGGSLPISSELPATLRHWLSDCLAPCAASATDPADGGTSSPTADPIDWADVQASLGGDHDAYARLVRRYQQTIGVTMWRFTRQRQLWEELVHDVFVEAYLGLNGYRGRAPFSHWLRRIATRVGYRFWKRRRRQERELPLDEAANAAVSETTRPTRNAKRRKLSTNCWRDWRLEIDW